jgi:hypothetical protein
MILRLCQRPVITEYVSQNMPKQYVHVVENTYDDQQQNVTDVTGKLVSVGNTRIVCLLTRYNVHSPSSVT